MAEEQAAPVSRVLMQKEDSGPEVSIRGMTFDVDADGYVEIPVNMLEEMQSHGFVQVERAEEEDKADRKANGKKK